MHDGLDQLDHVAILVRSIEDTVERLGQLDAPSGEIEAFPGEGTRELYLGEPGRAGRLLLLQPLGDSGPYARAMAKRGPGLHHVAFRTRDIDAL
ncbi:MAG: VOC family protein, partial [Planctomycetota bacterium]